MHGDVTNGPARSQPRLAAVGAVDDAGAVRSSCDQSEAGLQVGETRDRGGPADRAEPADLRVKPFSLEDVTDIQAEALEAGAQVLADVVLIARQGPYVERRGVIERLPELLIRGTVPG